MRSKIGLILLLGALVTTPGLAFAADDGHSLEQLVIETADSPAEHAALARHFRAKAAEARAEAARHESMAKAYSLQKRGALDQMGRHCKNLAANNAASASDYDALAALHEAQSKATK